jgi:hypothetical protein
MSFDLTVKQDSRYSRSTAKDALESFLAGLPGVRRNGTSGFVLNPTPDVWMEIYCEAADRNGDSTEAVLQNHDRVNCVRLHIPYRFLKPEALEQDYLPVAFAITKHLGWELYDEQDDHPDTPVYPKKSSGWKLWGIIVGIICIAVALVAWGLIAGPVLPSLFLLVCLARYAYGRRKKKT